MKALSVKEPWASRIAYRGKTIETRDWYTPFRGPLLICASRKPESAVSGKAVAIVNMIDCRPMRPEDEVAGQCLYYPGAYAWLFADIKPLEMPFCVKGQLGIFDVEVPS